MATVRKRKIRVKKKNFAIFVIFVMFFVFSLYEIGFVIYKVITTSEPKVEEKVSKKK